MREHEFGAGGLDLAPVAHFTPSPVVESGQPSGRIMNFLAHQLNQLAQLFKEVNVINAGGDDLLVYCHFNLLAQTFDFGQ